MFPIDHTTYLIEASSEHGEIGSRISGEDACSRSIARHLTISTVVRVDRIWKEGRRSPRCLTRCKFRQESELVWATFLTVVHEEAEHRSDECTDILSDDEEEEADWRDLALNNYFVFVLNLF